MDALKPFLLVACVAFVVGFVGYLVVGRVTAGPASLQAAAPAQAAEVSAPVSDDWNFAKKI
jgi:hypothetical protein